MTIGELKDYISGLDDELPVYTALQPGYPMRGELLNVCVRHNSDGDVESVFLASSNNEDYDVPEDAWDAYHSYPDEEEEEEEECEDEEDDEED